MARVFGLLNFVVLGFNGIMLPIEFLYPQLQWIAYLNPLYYAYQAMMLAAQGDAFDGDFEGWEATDHACVLLAMMHVVLGVFWWRCASMTAWAS